MRARSGALLLAIAAALFAAPALADDPLPRFEDAMCPGVAGLTVEAAEMVVGRIRENAAAVGRRLAPVESCRPNVIVAFVGNGKSMIDAMRRDQDYIFNEMTAKERNAIFTETGPVHVVSRLAMRTRDGAPVYRQENLVAPPQASMWMAHSKIYTGTQWDIIHALILIDQAAVRGMTVFQLGDYATMRALVHNPPEGGEIGADSILNLFSAPASSRPAQLTAYDHALLGALYEGVPNLRGEARIAAIEQATGLRYPRE